MKVIGITGGIGSGKSTVTRIIYHLGARIIDADLISRNITKKGSVALQELVEGFGEEILTQKGALNRKKLASIVFSDSDKRSLLNSITHKHISAEISGKLERLRNKGNIEFVVLDVALPIKEGFLEFCDEVWAVAAAKSTRIERIIKRSGLTAEEAEARIKSQPSDDAYIKIADVVIENNGTVEELERTVAKLFMQLKTR